jgi:hypothetical protein
VRTDCQKLLNDAVETLVEIFKFQEEETQEEIFKREQDEWRKEKELLFKKKETALIKATAVELKAITDLVVKAEAEKKALSDLLLTEKNKPKVCGADCTKDHINDGACLICKLSSNFSNHTGHNCKYI